MALGCSLYFHSVHSGTTSGDIKMNFGRAERGRYKKIIVPIYGTFLQKCYCKSFRVLLIRCFIIVSNSAPEECRARALPMEEGFEGLAMMDLEAAGADFDSVPQASKNIAPDPSSSSNASTGPTETPVLQSQPPGRQSHPRMPASPSLPSSRSGTPAAACSRPNTPPVSPALSLPNTPPISPVCLRPNSPPLPPSLSHSITPRISPARSCPSSPPIIPAGTRGRIPVASQVERSMLEPTGKDTLMASEVVSVENLLRSSG